MKEEMVFKRKRLMIAESWWGLQKSHKTRGTYKCQKDLSIGFLPKCKSWALVILGILSRNGTLLG
jgi:hypothetical protein